MADVRRCPCFIGRVAYHAKCFRRSNASVRMARPRAGAPSCTGDGRVPLERAATLSWGVSRHQFSSAGTASPRLLLRSGATRRRSLHPRDDSRASWRSLYGRACRSHTHAWGGTTLPVNRIRAALGARARRCQRDAGAFASILRVRRLPQRESCRSRRARCRRRGCVRRAG